MPPCIVVEGWQANKQSVADQVELLVTIGEHTTIAPTVAPTSNPSR